MRATYTIKYFDEKKNKEITGGFISFIEVPEDIDRILKIYDEFYKDQFGVTATVQLAGIDPNAGEFEF